MPVESHRLARIVTFLALEENFRALALEQAFFGRVINPGSGLKRGVQLEERLGPQHPFVQSLAHVLADALVANLDEVWPIG